MPAFEEDPDPSQHGDNPYFGYGLNPETGEYVAHALDFDCKCKKCANLYMPTTLDLRMLKSFKILWEKQ